jgi:hypothetical protein
MDNICSAARNINEISQRSNPKLNGHKELFKKRARLGHEK